MCFSEKNFNALMATAIMLILVIPVGIANVWLGYVVGESPCVLCWWERIGMILVGLLGLFILRYGPRLRYVAAVFFIAAFGMHMGLRHLGNFVQLDVDMGLGASILGVRTYTWAAIVYWAVVIVMSLFLIFIKKSAELNADFSGQRNVIKPFSAYGKVVFYLSFALVISNGVQAFFTNGIPPYGGKAPTDRMSLNLAMSSKTWERYVWD
ncbi:MAG: disulfide bond formation protein B, partial [Campylobacter sp.]|nr:disulfide bond formation protein B [Campylobacter sp.]